MSGRVRRWMTGTIAAAVLSGAAPAAAPPPPQGGTIAIEPATADGEYDPALPAFADALSKTLTDRGFTILDDPAHAAYWAKLTLAQAAVGTGLAKDPAADKVRVGAGVIVPLSTGHSAVVALRRSTLELVIQKRDGDVAWRGKAVTVRTAETRGGSDAAVAAALTQALLEQYPAMPKAVIGVP